MVSNTRVIPPGGDSFAFPPDQGIRCGRPFYKLQNFVGEFCLCHVKTAHPILPLGVGVDMWCDTNWPGGSPQPHAAFPSSLLSASRSAFTSGNPFGPVGLGVSVSGGLQEPNEYRSLPIGEPGIQFGPGSRTWPLLQFALAIRPPLIGPSFDQNGVSLSGVGMRQEPRVRAVEGYLAVISRARPRNRIRGFQTAPPEGC
jgi:hypothetical protein